MLTNYVQQKINYLSIRSVSYLHLTCEVATKRDNIIYTIRKVYVATILVAVTGIRGNRTP